MGKMNYHKFFLNLGNELKVDIISELEKKNKSVKELAERLKEERSTVSHALSDLLKCNFVFVKKKGRKRLYRLNEDTVLPLLNIANDHVQKYCEICRR